MTTYKITVGLSWSGAGGPGVNIWHFRDSAIPGTGGNAQWGVDALLAFYTGCLGLYSNDVVITMPNEVIADPYGEPSYYSVDGWTTTGQGGGGKAPPATALVVGWRTSSASRAGRGRTFLSPITSAAVEGDGTVNGTQLTAVRNAAQTLIDNSTTEGDGAFGVYSQTQGVLRDFTSVRIQDKFAVLRSRRD